MDISARVHGNLRLPIGAVLSLLPALAYSKARVVVVSGGTGAPVPGPWALDGTNNGTLTIGPFTDPTVLNVETLDGDVGLDITREWMHPEILGGDASVAALETLSLARQSYSAGYTVLVCTASAGGARCNNLYNVPDSTTYGRAAGSVQVICSAFTDADIGRYVKIASAKNPRLAAILKVTAVSDAGGGRTLIVGTEQFATVPRSDVTLGSVHGDSTMIVHDLQSNPNAHGQFAKANAMLGGVLDFTNMGLGGSNTAGWQNPDLRAYIEGMPQFDFAFVDFGYGNDATQPTSSTADILARLDECLSWVEKRARRVFFLGCPGGRLGGDDAPVANPQLTPDYTTLQIANQYLRRFIATRHRTVKFIDSERSFLRAGTYGLTDTTSISRSEPPQQLTEDGGIHLSPAGTDELAIDLAGAVRPYVGDYDPTGYARADYIGSNSVADAGGVAHNPNMLYQWFGAVPTAAVSFDTYLVGTGIIGTTCSGSGFSGAQDGTLSVIPSPRGGVAMRMAFADPRASDDPNPNPTLTLIYRGDASTQTVLAAVNDARAQAGDVDLFARLAVWGANQQSIFQIVASLVVTDAQGNTRKVASWACDDGSDNMQGAHRAWCNAFTRGVYRAGNGRCAIPPKTFTDAYILFQVVGTPIAGAPMGNFYFEIEDFQICRREFALAPEQGAWA